MARRNRIEQVAKAISLTNKQPFNMIAVVVKGGRVLSIGCNNMTRSHRSTYNGEFSRGVHAEFAALRQLRFQDLTNASLHIFYFRKDGSLGDSKPCDQCEKQIHTFGVGTVFYLEDGTWKKSKVLPKV